MIRPTVQQGDVYQSEKALASNICVSFSPCLVWRGNLRLLRILRLLVAGHSPVAYPPSRSSCWGKRSEAFRVTRLSVWYFAPFRTPKFREGIQGWKTILIPYLIIDTYSWNCHTNGWQVMTSSGTGQRRKMRSHPMARPRGHLDSLTLKKAQKPPDDALAFPEIPRVARWIRQWLPPQKRFLVGFFNPKVGFYRFLVYFTVFD